MTLAVDIALIQRCFFQIRPERARNDTLARQHSLPGRHLSRVQAERQSHFDLCMDPPFGLGYLDTIKRSHTSYSRRRYPQLPVPHEDPSSCLQGRTTSDAGEEQSAQYRKLSGRRKRQCASTSIPGPNGSTRNRPVLGCQFTRQFSCAFNGVLRRQKGNSETILQRLILRSHVANIVTGPEFRQRSENLSISLAEWLGLVFQRHISI